jgi:hypothetical protein
LYGNPQQNAKLRPEDYRTDFENEKDCAPTSPAPEIHEVREARGEQDYVILNEHWEI